MLLSYSLISTFAGASKSAPVIGDNIKLYMLKTFAGINL
jgi:hypothetical protein